MIQPRQVYEIKDARGARKVRVERVYPNDRVIVANCETDRRTTMFSSRLESAQLVSGT